MVSERITEEQLVKALDDMPPSITREEAATRILKALYPPENATLEDVAQTIVNIRAVLPSNQLRDDKAAASMERALWKRVLKVVATTRWTPSYTQELASAALRTAEIKFRRY